MKYAMPRPPRPPRSVPAAISRAASAALLALSLTVPPAQAQPPQPGQQAELSGSLLRPRQLPLDETLLERLSLPPGSESTSSPGAWGSHAS